MSLRVKKLPFPDELLAINYILTINQEGISEDGEPLVAISKRGKCIFSECSKRIVDSEGKEIVLLGKVIIKGDVAPTLKNVADGQITINGYTYDIHTGYRPRNPDGTVHHTMFEVK